MGSKPMSLKRGAERAELRRGPAWSWHDAGPLGVIVLAGLTAILAPGLLADVGDTVVGSTRYVPAVDATPSGLLIAASRISLACLIGWMVWHVRQAPLTQRWAWAIVAVGVLMNYARNTYSGAPATLSFLLLHIGLMLLVWRLTSRPTIHQQLHAALQAGVEKDARIAELEAQNARYRDGAWRAETKRRNREQ